MSSIDISASGLAAQRTRLDIIAENLANAQTTRTADGGAYKRLQAVLAADGKTGEVAVTAIVQDPRAAQQVYNPGHPDANAAGYVDMPNVNPVEEMVDLVTATRAYEANVTALNASKAMTRKALDIGRS